MLKFISYKNVNFDNFESSQLQPHPLQSSRTPSPQPPYHIYLHSDLSWIEETSY